VRRIAILLALVSATTLVAAGVAFTQVQEDSDPYIVVLEESVDNQSQVANAIEGRQEGLEVGFVYSEAIEGFSAEIPDGSVDEVRNNRQVAFVERDEVVRTTEQVLPWGINRIDADESSTVAGDGAGEVAGVNVYVIDTGVDVNHADLDMTQEDHQNFHGGANTDCDGHGTRVAGTLAAEDNTEGVVGAAPGARLIGVRVLNCNGAGFRSNVIKGVDWVTENERKPENAATPAVANMSLGGGRSRALERAVKESVRSGVFYSVSAGNEGENACKTSPAHAGAGKNNGIVTTAAIRRSGEETAWSNSGRCVDIWAPGQNIRSTKLGGGTATSTGTSIAAPHVGGSAALYLSSNPAVSPAAVERRLKEDSKRTGEKSEDGRRVQLVHAGRY
jgi:subtilisin family serine protease